MSVEEKGKIQFPGLPGYPGWPGPVKVIGSPSKVVPYGTHRGIGFPGQSRGHDPISPGRKEILGV